MTYIAIAILATAVLALIAMWAPALFGFGYSESIRNRRDERRARRLRAEQMERVDDRFLEAQEREDRRLERDREREAA